MNLTSARMNLINEKLDIARHRLASLSRNIYAALENNNMDEVERKILLKNELENLSTTCLVFFSAYAMATDDCKDLAQVAGQAFLSAQAIDEKIYWKFFAEIITFDQAKAIYSEYADKIEEISGYIAICNALDEKVSNIINKE